MCANTVVVEKGAVIVQEFNVFGCSVVFRQTGMMKKLVLGCITEHIKNCFQ